MKVKKIISYLMLVLGFCFIAQMSTLQARGGGHGFGGGGHSFGGGRSGGGHGFGGSGHSFHSGGRGGYSHHGNQHGIHNGHHNWHHGGHHNGYWRNGYGYGYWNDAGLWIPLAVGAGIGAAAVASDYADGDYVADNVCDEGQYLDPNTGECVPAEDVENY